MNCHSRKRTALLTDTVVNSRFYLQIKLSIYILPRADTLSQADTDTFEKEILDFLFVYDRKQTPHVS